MYIFFVWLSSFQTIRCIFLYQICTVCIRYVQHLSYFLAYNIGSCHFVFCIVPFTMNIITVSLWDLFPYIRMVWWPAIIFRLQRIHFILSLHFNVCWALIFNALFLSTFPSKIPTLMAGLLFFIL